MSIGRVSLNTNNQTNFTDINNALQPGRTGYGQKRHLRMDGGNELYAKYPHAPKGNQAALRLQKKRNAATFVATAIDREYGQGTADYVFAKLQNSNGLNFRANGATIVLE